MGYPMETIIGYKTSYIFLGLFYELFFQYPSFLPHPVKIMGRIISGGDELLNRAGDSRVWAITKGFLLTVICVGSVYIFFYYLDMVIKNIYIRFFYNAFFTVAVLASGSLFFECLKVAKLCELKMTEESRKALSMLVTRDTAHMNQSKIYETTIETLSENLCDGVIAPMFYLFLGGVPLAMAYKMASTLDSMIGYRNDRYEYFGKAAARLDDLLNFIPARITAFLIFISAFVMGLNFKEGFNVWKRDKNKTDSPNSGHPESSMAGVLGIKFGGRVSYFGKEYDKPIIGTGRTIPSFDTVKLAIRVSYLCVLIFLVMGLTFEYLTKRFL